MLVKRDTTLLPPGCLPYTLKGAFPDWTEHPSWITALEQLDSYNRWVSGIVLPIAFQWIQENYDAVYQTIPSDKRDDVGLVVAAAFNLVKDMPYYQSGAAKCEQLKADMKDDPCVTDTINPVWAATTRSIRQCIQEAEEGS